MNSILNDHPFLNDSRVWWTFFVLIFSVLIFVAIRNISNIKYKGANSTANHDKKIHKEENEIIQPILSKSQKDRLSQWDTVQSEPFKVVNKRQVKLTNHENDEDDENDEDNDNNEEDNDQLPELIPSDTPNVDKEMIAAGDHMTPTTKEQAWYRKIFCDEYPNRDNVVPYFWMPRWVDATDASARTLKCYNNANQTTQDDQEMVVEN